MLLIPSADPDLAGQLDSTAHIVATELAYGRSLAVSNNDQYRFTFDIPNNRFYLQYAGANPALATLPITAFSSPGDPPTQHITDFDLLPHLGPTVQLLAVASTGNTISPVSTVTFSPLGGTVSAVPTTIWLSAGGGQSTKYISVTVNPVTGLAVVGPLSTTGPPPSERPIVEPSDPALK